MGSELAFPFTPHDELGADWCCLVFAKDEIVFARTSPKHKLEIGMLLLCLDNGILTRNPVKRAQALGHIVGVCVPNLPCTPLT
jgi:hypothetical protein